MNNFKKIISLALIISQIGCANHVLHSQLSNTGFDSNYSYTIHTNQSVNFPNVSGAAIQNQSDRILITQNGQTKYLLHTQITEIDGESYQTIGSHAGDGALIGGLAGGVLIGLLSGIGSNFEECHDDCEINSFLSYVFGGLLGIALGGAIGAGVGAVIPKKSQVKITPTFSSSSNNMGAGANLSVRF